MDDEINSNYLLITEKAKEKDEKIDFVFFGSIFYVDLDNERIDIFQIGYQESGGKEYKMNFYFLKFMMEKWKFFIWILNKWRRGRENWSSWCYFGWLEV